MEQKQPPQMGGTEYIRLLVKMTPKKQTSLLRWFGSQGQTTHLEVFRLQGDLARQNRKQYTKALGTEYYFSMFLLALEKVWWLEQSLSKKAALTEEQLGEITRRRMAKIDAKRTGKGSRKKDLIRGKYYAEITNFLAAGKSWRWIADYLATYHKEILTHSYIRQCYMEKQDEQTIKDR